MDNRLLDSLTYHSQGLSRRYLGKSFCDGIVYVSVFFESDIENIDPRFIPYLYYTAEDAKNNPIVSPRAVKPNLLPGERLVFVQSSPYEDMVIQINGKYSLLDKQVYADMYLVHLTSIHLLAKIEGCMLWQFQQFLDDFGGVLSPGVYWEINSVRRGFYA